MQAAELETKKGWGWGWGRGDEVGGGGWRGVTICGCSDGGENRFKQLDSTMSKLHVLWRFRLYSREVVMEKGL